MSPFIATCRYTWKIQRLFFNRYGPIARSETTPKCYRRVSMLQMGCFSGLLLLWRRSFIFLRSSLCNYCILYVLVFPSFYKYKFRANYSKLFPTHEAVWKSCPDVFYFLFLSIYSWVLRFWRFLRLCWTFPQKVGILDNLHPISLVLSLTPS